MQQKAAADKLSFKQTIDQNNDPPPPSTNAEWQICNADCVTGNTYPPNQCNKQQLKRIKSLNINI